MTVMVVIGMRVRYDACDATSDHSHRFVRSIGHNSILFKSNPVKSYPGSDDSLSLTLET